MKKKVYILGSGFSSLAASCYMAKAGYEVIVLEKNEDLGGRARQLKRDGFTFDMGPTWYWMPDVFERFFSDFDKSPSDYYQIQKLDPAYSIYFDTNDKLIIGDSLDKIKETFESIETGSAKKLQSFINKAKDNYNIAIKDLVYKPGLSPLELITPKTISRLNQFAGTISKDIRKAFQSKKLVQTLEFPVLFLGAKPSDTPSFYNFMNFADFGLGTWHPNGGMFSVVHGIIQLAKELGVTFETNSPVEKIVVAQKKVTGLQVNGKFLPADLVISGADYHHTESLLPKQYRQYSEQYWNSKTYAPSALLFYVGFDKKVTNVDHHTLCFDVDFDAHAKSIYDTTTWPDEPLFYASFPSKTEPDMAPEGKEAGIFLIPIAPNLKDTETLRQKYFKKIITRLETLTGEQLESHILFEQSFCVNDFINDYNSYKGNAYGMANTLLQTAFLRPKLKSKKVSNLFFTGQLTVPGPGVPPSLISGKLSAELASTLNKK